MTGVLYISYDGITDPLGQSQILPYIVGLSQSDYRFTLISYEKPERYSLHKATVQAICSANSISWHPLPYTKFPPVLSTIRDFIKLKAKVKSLHKELSFSVVHCRSYLPSLIGLAMKRRYNTKFIFDMRGFWADERIEGGIWNLSNPIYRIIYNYFKIDCPYLVTN